jgi:hypothetical protein
MTGSLVAWFRQSDPESERCVRRLDGIARFGEVAGVPGALDGVAEDGPDIAQPLGGALGDLRVVARGDADPGTGRHGPAGRRGRDDRPAEPGAVKQS